MSPTAAAVVATAKTASEEITTVAAFEAPQRGSLVECGKEVLAAIVERLEGVGTNLERKAQKLRTQGKKYEALVGMCEGAVSGQLALIKRKFTDPRCLARTTREQIGNELDVLVRPFAQTAQECIRPDHPSIAVMNEVLALNAFIGKKFFDVDTRASGTLLAFEPRG